MLYSRKLNQSKFCDFVFCTVFTALFLLLPFICSVSTALFLLFTSLLFHIVYIVLYSTVKYRCNVTDAVNGIANSAICL